MGNVRLGLDVDTSRYKYTPPNINVPGQVESVQESVRMWTAELRNQNTLLEGIKDAIDNKQLNIGDRDIFLATQREQRRFHSRTNKIGWAGI